LGIEYAPLFGGALRIYLFPAILLAASSFGVAIVLRLWIGKRRFERRNFAGVEGFEDYGHAVKSRFVEGFVELIMTGFLFVFALSAGAAMFITLLG